MAVFHLFSLDNISQETVFCDILERKNAFLAYKNKKFKQSKNWDFSKGVTHGFGQKMAVFHLFSLDNISQETVFCDILERKNAFLAYKNKKFKKSKNWDFSKRVNPSFLIKKWPFFHLFF